MSLSLFGQSPITKKRKKQKAEPIDMRSRRFGYFPRTFVWQGREYQVKAVERTWNVASRRNDGQIDRYYFQVRCAEGTFIVYQDLRHNTWHIVVGGG